MASQKTVPSTESAEAFIASVPNGARREDAQKLSGLLSKWTGEPPVMWVPRIVGFGSYRYRCDSGREGTAALVGFAPQKEHLVLYLVGGVQDRYPRLLQQLGPHQAAKGACTSNASTTLISRCFVDSSIARYACIAAQTGEPAPARVRGGAASSC